MIFLIVYKFEFGQIYAILVSGKVCISNLRKFKVPAKAKQSANYKSAHNKNLQITNSQWPHLRKVYKSNKLFMSANLRICDMRNLLADPRTILTRWFLQFQKLTTWGWIIIQLQRNVTTSAFRYELTASWLVPTQVDLTYINFATVKSCFNRTKDNAFF